MSEVPNRLHVPILLENASFEAMKCPSEPFSTRISDRSRKSLTPPAVGGGLSGRVQGVASCTLCHALLQLFAGRQRVEAFAEASELPAPSKRLVARAMGYELLEEEDLEASESFCRLHHLHKNRQGR